MLSGNEGRMGPDLEEQKYDEDEDDTGIEDEM
jgi:hypothetical protein